MLVYCPVIASIKPSLIQSVIRSNRLPINQPLTEQAGKQRNQRCTNQSDTSACHKLLDPLGFAPGLSFRNLREGLQHPMRQTCAQGDHKDLQSINRACKKCHNVPPLISEILICDMAVSGRKQKSRRTVFRKKSVSNSTAAWGRKNPAVICFSGRITNPQNILLSS